MQNGNIVFISYLLWAYIQIKTWLFGPFFFASVTIALCELLKDSEARTSIEDIHSNPNVEMSDTEVEIEQHLHRQYSPNSLQEVLDIAQSSDKS
jgi:hypothetical protein